MSIHHPAFTGHRSTGEVVGNALGRFDHQQFWDFWSLWVLGCQTPRGAGAQLCCSSPGFCHPISSPAVACAHNLLPPVLFQLPAFPGFRIPSALCSFCVFINPKKDLCPTSSSQPPCRSLLAPTASSGTAFQHFSLKWVWKWHSLVSKQKFGGIGVFSWDLLSWSMLADKGVYFVRGKGNWMAPGLSIRPWISWP